MFRTRGIVIRQVHQISGQWNLGKFKLDAASEPQACRLSPAGVPWDVRKYEICIAHSVVFLELYGP